jgi:tripartite-type tricarboxylate transporter receptor subunit TctC
MKATVCGALVGAILAAAASFSPTTAIAQGAVTFIVPFPAGGTSDIIARPLADDLGRALGQTVVVDNKPGAAGNIGAQQLAQSGPDGNTIMLTAAAIAVAPAMSADPGFTLFENVVPVTIVGAVPFMLVTRPDLPVASTAELIDYARANPGALNFGSGGNGTIVHLAGELLKQRTGIDFEHIPFRGGVQAIQEIMGGVIDFTIDGGPHVIQQIEAGTIKLVAVATAERLAAYPDVPTMAESGVAGLEDFEASAWQGLFVPGGTSPERIAQLNAEVAKSVNAPESLDRLKALGVVPVAGPVEQTEAFVRAEVEKWAGAVKAAGIAAQ